MSVRRGNSGSPLLPLVAGKEPALRPVLQRIDRVRKIERPQCFSTQYRAGTTGAVYNNRCFGIGHEFSDPQRRLAVRTTNTAWNIEVMVFAPGPAIDDDMVRIAFLKGDNLFRGEVRRMVGKLEQFTERLTREVLPLVKGVA